jgi:Ca2+-binding EF-hand superfamily protein
LGINAGKIGFPDFMKYMKLLLAQSFSEKLEVFFETFDLDKNSCFSWDEIF